MPYFVPFTRLESEHELHGSQASEVLQIAGTSNPIFAKRYKHSGEENDDISQKSTFLARRCGLENVARLDTEFIMAP